MIAEAVVEAEGHPEEVEVHQEDAEVLEREVVQKPLLYVPLPLRLAGIVAFSNPTRNLIVTPVSSSLVERRTC